MSNAKITFNGSPLTETAFEDEIENAVLKGVITDITEKIGSVLTPEELEQITINFAGGLDKLSVTLSGDDKLLAKAGEALQG